MADQRVSRVKLHPPRLPVTMVDRPRLMAAMDDGLCRGVILVSAPAGYGKTTTVCQWLHHQPLPAAWLTVDAADNDPIVLMSGLIAAVRTVFPDSCSWFSDAVADSALPLADRLVERFADELDGLEEFVLVLDDCDSLRGDGGPAVLDQIVRRMPQALRLVFLCRRDPPLPLGSLRGQGRLAELRVRDLRFDDEEAAAFLEGLVGSPFRSDTVSTLVKRTEGWIAGLYLLALSIRGREDSEALIRDLTASDRFIADYLMEEVIGRLSVPVREFLLATSILERLCSPLCRAVVGDGTADTVDGRPILQWLEEGNLFLLPIGSEGIWFRYHGLFRELLRQRLRSSRRSGEMAELHRRAAEWLTGERQIGEALGHLLAAGDTTAACALVVAETEAFEREERWHDLERWIRLLPREMVEAEPELVVAEAWIFQLRQAWDDLVRSLDMAEALLHVSPEYPDRTRLQGDLWALRSRWLYRRGDGPSALDLARRVVDPCRPVRPQARALALSVVGGGLQMQGDIEAARRSFDGLRTGGDGGLLPPRALAGLGLLELTAGNLTEASDVAEAMMVRAQPLGLTDSIGWSHMLQGVVAYQRDDLDAAERHFGAVVAEPLGVNIVPVKECFFGLALLRRAREDLEASTMVADEATRLMASTGNPELVSQARSLRVRLELLSGHQIAVPSWLDANGDLPEVFGLDVVYEYPPLTLAHALVSDGLEAHLDRAASILSRLGEVAERVSNTYRRIQVGCLQALLCDARGDPHGALDAVSLAVELGRPGGFVRMYADFGGHMLPLLERLLVGGRRDDHIVRLIEACCTLHRTGDGTALSSARGRGGVPETPSGSARAATTLTNRELDVLVLLDQRLSNKEIARRLVISPATVKRHSLSIYRKLGVGGRREAAVVARELGILPLP